MFFTNIVRIFFSKITLTNAFVFEYKLEPANDGEKDRSYVNVTLTLVYTLFQGVCRALYLASTALLCKSFDHWTHLLSRAVNLSQTSS